jgi:Cof subfamily protein (haloacid dehalogenase superfamily)
MNKPVICFDFDGTLVDRNGRIHPHDVQILKREDRAVFVPATGRPLHAVRHAFARNGLVFESTIPFPMILQNGAVVYLPGEEILTQRLFPAAKQVKIIEISQRHSQVCCLLFGLNQVEIMWPNTHGLKMIERFDLDVLPFRAANQRYTKIMFISDAPANIKPVADKITSLSVEATYSLPTVYELSPTGIDKGHMLVNLLTKMDLQSANIVVAGDGENDLSLFDVADVSFCPEGSVMAVKEKANATIVVAKTGLLAPMLAQVGIG